MIGFFVLVKLYLFALLFGGGITKSRCMNKEVFGQSFESQNLLFILNIKGVVVTPKNSFIPSLEIYKKITSFIPAISVLNIGLLKSHYKTYFITFLSIYFGYSLSSSSRFVRSVRLVNTSIPKILLAGSIRELGYYSFFYSSISNAVLMV